MSDPNADADGDGQSNLAEYLANTNLTNAASAFQITSLAQQTNGHWVVSWTTVGGGTRYRVQYRDTSPAGGAFTDVVRALTNELDMSPWGVSSTQSFTDDFTLTGGPPPGAARFYRVKLVP